MIYNRKIIYGQVYRKFINLPDDQIDRFKLRDGDIVLARAIGSLEHLGKAIVVYPGKYEWTFDSHLMRIRLDKARLLPEILKIFLESNQGRKEFLRQTRRSAVQFNINGKELRNILIPLPPISLQLVFLEWITNIESIQSQQSIALEKAEATFQSLLHRAFAGEL
jgi:type I restriction enzyme S subunit